MNINKKYIIILGTLILSLIIITGAITYYNEKKKQVNTFETFQKERIAIFSQAYPTNTKETSDFIDFCKNAVFSSIEELKGKGIKNVACVLVKIKETSPNIYTAPNSYTPIFTSLDSISQFKSGRYIGIAINLKDVINKDNPVLLEEEKLYFCSISSPSLTDSLILQLIPNKILTFDEGNISCAGIKMDKTPAMVFPGFVPKAESLNIKLYLVNEQTASGIMNKKSFSEIKDTLNDYPIIWQMEKPISL